ncbi:MAG: Rrf2 family transcriptional regulator [Actinomycetota bacterium]|nr:Rrf2 family transcriptional regulator [Actinomycetota bacterium]
MRVSAKADYAIRALVEIAARQPADGPPRPVKGDAIAAAQDIPMKFCENILSELRTAGIVASRRGSEGGYWPAIPTSQIRLGDVIRVVEGPLAAVRGERPSDVEFTGTSAPLQAVWVAARAALRRVLDTVTIADVVAGHLPPVVAELLGDDGAWSAVRIPG